MPLGGATAKPVRLAFESIYIKQRLDLTDEEPVLQIQEHTYIQFFLGFSGYSCPVSTQSRLKVRHKAAGAAMLVPVLSGLLSSLAQAFCQPRSDLLPAGPAGER